MVIREGRVVGAILMGATGNAEGDVIQATAMGAQALAVQQSINYTRANEYEADRVGLRVMARAGYDPRHATAFWARMAALGGDSPPEWLSTHPSNENRIQQLEELMPEAVQIYEASQQPQAP